MYNQPWWARLPKPLSKIVFGWRTIWFDFVWWFKRIGCFAWLTPLKNGPPLVPLLGYDPQMPAVTSSGREPWAMCKALMGLKNTAAGPNMTLQWDKHMLYDEPQFILRLVQSPSEHCRNPIPVDMDLSFSKIS